MIITFRFVDPKLNDAFIRLIHENLQVPVEKSQLVCPEELEEKFMGYLAEFRRSLFEDWQVLNIPMKDYYYLFKRYMIERNIPYVEEYEDHEIQFLLPKSYKPRTWRIR